MKKIAMMFAAAAMFAACGETAKEIALTAQDSLDVQAAVEAAIAQEIGEEPAAPVLAEGETEIAPEVQAAYDSLKAAFDAKKAEVEATREAKLVEAYANKLAELTAAATGAAEETTEEPAAE
ncbi:MAG: hypothetical protein IJT98_02000 [Prevotella sp.]|nr:hypothetical protein [Prevotella sp.]